MKFKIFYLWFGLPIIIVILWFVAFYGPMASAIDRQRKELATVQRNRDTVAGALHEVLEMRTRDARAKSSLGLSSQSIPVVNQFPGVIKAVAETAKKEGLAFETLSATMLPNDPQLSSGLTKTALDMGVKGRFIDMGRFLEDVERQKGFKRVVDAKISYTDAEYPVLTGRFFVEFRAWKGDRAFEGQ